MSRLVLAALAAVVVAGAQASTPPRFNPDPVFPVGSISPVVSHQIARLDHVASALAGRRAIVNCWSRPDWTRLQEWSGRRHAAALVDASGMTWPTTRRIQLSPSVCQGLSQQAARAKDEPLLTAWAVTVLAHESAHASGIAAENRAECRAIRTEPRAARLLGIPAPLATRFQHIYRGTVYPTYPHRYRTPPCAAGQPGVVAADTAGTPAALRPLSHIATVLARSLPGWSNIGGAADLGSSTPCRLIASRATEVARFGELLLGPHGVFVFYTGVVVHTSKQLAAALARYQALPRCDLQQRRTQIRESHSTNTVALGRIPASVTHLSREIRAFREIGTSKGKTLNLDSIFVFDRAKRTLFSLFFSAPIHRLSTSVELRATAAGIEASRHSG